MSFGNISVARPKKNHKDAMPTHPQKLYPLVKELGLMLNQGNILSDYPESKKLIDLLLHRTHLETVMKRLNSGRNIIFRIILCFVIIGLTKSASSSSWTTRASRRR